MLADFQASGMTINYKKSQLVPSQQVTHLGFALDLNKRLLQIPSFNLKSVRKELGKFLTQDEMSCRRAAAILGPVRSFLTALPFLRAFTDLLRAFCDQHFSAGWDVKDPISKALKDQVLEIGTLLRSWEGRSFTTPGPLRKIYSDSSTQGWGAIDLTSGRRLHEFWRSEKSLHINIKELKASLAATRSLASPGETVHLRIDNQVAYSYLKKRGGGRLPLFNALLRPFLKWCHAQQVALVPNWVSSESMLADGLSRWNIDRGDYTLKSCPSHHLQNLLEGNFHPQVDMFASPGNAQLAAFVSRWPHFQAVSVNAL
jgi:hypothetical protein